MTLTFDRHEAADLVSALQDEIISVAEELNFRERGAKARHKRLMRMLGRVERQVRYEVGRFAGGGR